MFFNHLNTLHIMNIKGFISFNSCFKTVFSERFHLVVLMTRLVASSWNDVGDSEVLNLFFVFLFPGWGELCSSSAGRGPHRLPA